MKESLLHISTQLEDIHKHLSTTLSHAKRKQMADENVGLCIHKLVDLLDTDVSVENALSLLFSGGCEPKGLLIDSLTQAGCKTLEFYNLYKSVSSRVSQYLSKARYAVLVTCEVALSLRMAVTAGYLVVKDGQISVVPEGEQHVPVVIDEKSYSVPVLTLLASAVVNCAHVIANATNMTSNGTYQFFLKGYKEDEEDEANEYRRKLFAFMCFIAADIFTGRADPTLHRDLNYSVRKRTFYIDNGIEVQSLLSDRFWEPVLPYSAVGFTLWMKYSQVKSHYSILS